MKNIEIDDKAKELAQNVTITENVGFGKTMGPIMLECDYANGTWGELKIIPYGPITLDPTAKVLHYGQEIFEGLKAYKNEDGEVYLFRPDMNAKRFNHSARRMSMPCFPEEDFINGCSKLSAYLNKLVPKRLGESLYLRPFMIATEINLGIKPSENFKFLIIASPVGNYFSKPNVKVFIEREDCRAAAGGTGSAKTGGNYAASLKSYATTLEKGCDQTMWLDASEHKYIEEMSGMNFVAIINGELHTPELTETILHGVTRNSILALATEQGMKVVERKMNINEFLKDVESGACSEAFVCGTASVLTPINSFLDANDKAYFLNDAYGKVSKKIKENLLMIQSGRIRSKNNWSFPVEIMK
jgi:branched-chain amino acid aminotransferase